MDGWIKLHRSLMENPFFRVSAHLHVWLYLLLNATHKPRKIRWGGETITLQPGQLVTGRKKIAEETGVNESKVYRILKDLKSEQQIEQQSGNISSIITIVNWGKYQNDEQQNEQPVNNERTASEQRVNTNKNGNNGKNDENGKKTEYSPDFETWWEIYPRKERKQASFKKWKRLSRPERVECLARTKLWIAANQDRIEKGRAFGPANFLEENIWMEKIQGPKPNGNGSKQPKQSDMPQTTKGGIL